MKAKFNGYLRLILILVSLLTNKIVFSQDKVIQTQLGDFKLLTLTEHGATIETDNSIIELSVYSPTIIRAQFRKKGGEKHDDFSYAVIKSAKMKFSKIAQDSKNIRLVTDSIMVKVSKFPVRIGFCNLRNEELIEKDDEQLGVVWNGSEVTTFRTLFEGEKIMGLGQKTGDLNHVGSVLRNYNVDAAGFEPGTDPLYSSMPFYISFKKNSVSGLFFDNTYETIFDFNLAGKDDTYSVNFKGGNLNYYFFGSSSAKEIIQDYTYLTGRMSLPPLWGLGYIQSRYSYMTQDSVLYIANKFRENKIPADGIFCDIDYMDQFKVFSWDKERFPNPKFMVDSLRALGFHLYVILDPALKIQRGYKLYDEGTSKGYFARYPSGKFFTGSVWAGPSHLTDFINEDARNWWKENINFYTKDGITGFLNDMNEPSFLLKSTPDPILFGKSNTTKNFKEIHNAYGMQMARSTYEGVRKLTGQRPFNISRSAYSGIQRYSAMWTGDNQANDRHMMMDIRMCLSMNLTGLSYVGMNVGGFVGNPTDKLMIRWMQIGSYMPLFINHYEKHFQPREPFNFNESTKAELRKAIENRYALMPYIYSCFYQSSKYGTPILKVLPYKFPFDERVFEKKFQHQFIMGEDILVAPVESFKDSVWVYIPKGNWYRFSSERKYLGENEYFVSSPVNDLPVFIREGAIIPKQTPVQSTDDEGDGILELHFWNGVDRNTFTYYEDDGNTFEYEDNSFYKREIDFSPEERKIEIQQRLGLYDTKYNRIKIILHQFENISTIKINGKKKKLIQNSGTQEIVLNNEEKKITILY